MLSAPSMHLKETEKSQRPKLWQQLIDNKESGLLILDTWAVFSVFLLFSAPVLLIYLRLSAPTVDT